MKKPIATEKQLLENLSNYKFYYYHIITKDLITKHKDKVNWNYVSIFQTLSESFITKHKDKVNWYRVSSYQVLSEEFIIKHKDKVNWFRILMNQKIGLSYDFIEEHFQLITKEKEKQDISIPLKEKKYNFLEL